MKTVTGIDPPHVSSVLASSLVLLNINLHAGIMHTCQTPNICIHEHTSRPLQRRAFCLILSHLSMEPIRGWITRPTTLKHAWYFSCLHMFMAEMGFHLVHIPFLDAAAKYSVLFGDSLPPTLISQRARSIAVSTNSCVIGGDLPT